MADKVMLGKAQALGRREDQQDAYGSNYEEGDGIVSRGGVVAVVADGVGGHSHGKLASELAVRSFLQAYRSGPKHKNVPDALFYALHAANHAVCQFAKSKGERNNCGTTLIVAVVQPETRSLHWIGVGDSRLYLLRGKQLSQVTVDSNYAGYLRKRTVREVEASTEEEESSIELMALTSFLGKKKLTVIDHSIRPFQLEADDWLLLCTDGLYNALNPQEMTACLRGGPQTAADALLRSATAKGLKSQDNTTVAIMAFRDREAPANQPPPVAQAKLPESPPTAEPPPKRLRWLVLAVLLTLALSLGAAWLFYQKPRPAPLPELVESPGEQQPLNEEAKPGKTMAGRPRR